MARSVSLEQVQRVHVAVHVPPVARGAARAGRLERPDLEGGERGVVGAAAAARGREGDGVAARLEHPGAHQARVAHGVEHRGEQGDALLGGGARRGLCEPKRGGARRLVCAREAGEGLDLGHEARGRGGAVHGLDERVAIQPRAQRLRDAGATRNAHERQRLDQLHVLPELAHREPRAAAVGHAKGQLHLGLAGGGEDVGAQGEQLGARHASLPTVTLRNLAGLAPCPTCIICIGSPLPHWVMPHNRQSDAPQMASHEPQKRGVMPV